MPFGLRIYLKRVFFLAQNEISLQILHRSPQMGDTYLVATVQDRLFYYVSNSNKSYFKVIDRNNMREVDVVDLPDAIRVISLIGRRLLDCVFCLCHDRYYSSILLVAKDETEMFQVNMLVNGPLPLP